MKFAFISTVNIEQDNYTFSESENRHLYSLSLGIVI